MQFLSTLPLVTQGCPHSERHREDRQPHCGQTGSCLLRLDSLDPSAITKIQQKAQPTPSFIPCSQGYAKAKAGAKREAETGAAPTS